MVQVERLTPESLLAAPRRGPAVPNRNGKLALFTVSTHDFAEHKTNKEVRVMDIASGSSRQLCEGDKIHDALWVPGSDSDVLYLKSGEKGKTDIMVADGANVGRDHYHVSEIDAPISNLKLKDIGNGKVAFVVTGMVGKDGTLHNDEAAEKPSTGRIFDTYRVRIWNKLYDAYPHGIWYNVLAQQDNRWNLQGELHNLLHDTKVEPIGISDGMASVTSHIDISPQGVVFSGRDLSQRWPVSGLPTTPYWAPLPSFADPPPSKPRPISMPRDIGTGTHLNLRISPDGQNVAFLHLLDDDAANARLYMTSLAELDAFDVLSLVCSQAEKDYLPPDSFEFAGSSDCLILNRPECGRSVLAHLKLHDGEVPRVFFKDGVAQAFHPIEEGNWDQLLVTSTNYAESSAWQVVNVPTSDVIRKVSATTKNGAKFGISRDMVTEIWYEGADEKPVHSFIIRPSDFDENKKYPWILFPHGGPQSAHSDAWSTRWNVAMFAEQGYVVVCPNISGSTGYGADFTRRCSNAWGEAPFVDLLNLIDYLETLSYLDQDKAVLAGASYGGYMVSWMMGHEVINKFCCAIDHDGLWAIPTTVLQSDIVESPHEFGGPAYVWENLAGLERNNPGRPDRLRNWKNAPPTLVIHSEKDYRCVITEGLAKHRALLHHGVPCRFLTFPDECHWVLGAENSLLWHDTVLDWMRRCVDGELKRGDTEW